MFPQLERKFQMDSTIGHCSPPVGLVDDAKLQRLACLGLERNVRWSRLGPLVFIYFLHMN